MKIGRLSISFISMFLAVVLAISNMTFAYSDVNSFGVSDSEREQLSEAYENTDSSEELTTEDCDEDVLSEDMEDSENSEDTETDGSDNSEDESKENSEENSEEDTEESEEVDDSENAENLIDESEDDMKDDETDSVDESEDVVDSADMEDIDEEEEPEEVVEEEEPEDILDVTDSFAEENISIEQLFGSNPDEFYAYVKSVCGDEYDESKAKVLKGDIWICDFEDELVYSGTALKQSIRVFDRDILLNEGKDYKLSYKNNTNVKEATANGAPTITITMAGQYVGNKSFNYTIVSANISDATISGQGLAKSYNKKVQKYVPTVTFNGRKLTNNTHFTVSYESSDDNKLIGNETGITEVKIYISGKGNFTGETYAGVYYIVGADYNFSNAKITTTIKDFKYYGEPISEEKLGLTVKIGKSVIDHENYVVTMDNFDNAGTATLTVSPSETGKIKYAGFMTKTYKITGGIPFKQVVFDDAAWVPSFEYNKTVCEGEGNTAGEGFKQNLAGILSYMDNPLVEGTDFSVSYANNKKCGTAKVTFKGLGKFNGSLTKTFKIVQSDKLIVDDEESDFEAVYSLSGAVPKIVVKDSDGRVLEVKKDYTIKYTNNNKVGEDTATYQVTGTGNYSKKVIIKGTFSVYPRDLSDDGDGKIVITAPDKTFANKAGAYKSTPAITDNGKKLKAGKDYEKTIKYYLLKDGEDEKSVGEEITEDNLRCGVNIRAEVTGIGNYEGTISTVFRYYDKNSDIKKLFIKIDPQVYTGVAIEPELTNENGYGDIHVFLTKSDMNNNCNEVLNAGVPYPEAEEARNWYIKIESFSNNINSGKGTVELRAVGINGDGHGGAAKYTFTISKKSIVNVGINSVVIKESKVNLGLTDGDCKETTLSFKVNPANADYDAVWTSSDEKVATVDQNGKVSAKSAGISLITLTITDYKNKSASANCLVWVEGEKILPKDYITPQQYGAIADDGKDDSKAFDSAIDDLKYRYTDKYLFVPAGSYDIDIESRGGWGVVISGDNLVVVLDDKAVIKAMAANSGNYDLVLIYKAHNCSVSGGTIIGDKEIHTGNKGEWGHCIGVYESQDISIENINISNGWGDGIDIGDYDPLPFDDNRNIIVSNCTVHHNRRSNLSLTNGKYVIVNGCSFTNAKGKDPQFGIDIETNYYDNPVEHAYFSDCIIKDNAKGALGIMTPANDIVFENCSFSGTIYNWACKKLLLKNCTIKGQIIDDGGNKTVVE